MFGKSFFNLSCAEAAVAANKAEYKEANLKDKLRLRLHLFFCTTCKKYNENNHKLSWLLKKANLTTCTKEEKESYRQKMRESGSDTSENQQDHQP